MPLLSIFSSPKPFTNPHIATIQRNAIRSWSALGPEVEVLLLGDEAGQAETAAELGVRCLPEVECNDQGTPLVSSMFNLARQNSSAPLLCCVNADILLLPEIISMSLRAHAQAKEFLMVGQRWDLEVLEAWDFSQGWDERLRQAARQHGRLHKATGSDYFIFPRECFADMPKFAIGRAGWDNWMIYAGRSAGWPVIDASDAIMIIHQNHDYSHLPGGQPHYKLPETFENVRIGGGKRAVFELPDASHRLPGGELKTQPFSWPRFWREVEISPLTRLHSFALAKLFYVLMHPLKVYRDWRWKRSQPAEKRKA
jgi:hypothetical protein